MQILTAVAFTGWMVTDSGWAEELNLEVIRKFYALTEYEFNCGF